jgi:hypothetical protein
MALHVLTKADFFVPEKKKVEDEYPYKYHHFFGISGVEIRKPGMVAYICNSSYSRSRGRKITSLRPAQAKLARSYLKTK